MSEVSDARKAFEDSLRRIDELEGMRVERHRIRAEFECCLVWFVLGRLIGTV